MTHDLRLLYHGASISLVLEKSLARQPMSNEARRLRGPKHPERINKHRPEPKTELPPPPDYLSPEAKRHYSYVVEQQRHLGVLKGPDLILLCILADQTARYWELVEKIATFGVLLHGRRVGTVVKNPAIAAANQTAAIVISLLDRTGGSPAARQRLQLPAPPPHDLDAWAELAANPSAVLN